MVNTTPVKVPKKYHDKLIEIYQDSDGYWAYSQWGYHFKDMGYGCHSAHEMTQIELLKVIRSLAPCDCDTCTKERSQIREETKA